MLRITQAPGKNRPAVLRLEGRIAGPWVAELSNSCDQLLAEKRSIELNLAEVSYADQSGVNFLTKLKAGGVALVECSPFLEEQLKSPTRQVS